MFAELTRYVLTKKFEDNTIAPDELKMLTKLNTSTNNGKFESAFIVRFQNLFIDADFEGDAPKRNKVRFADKVICHELERENHFEDVVETGEVSISKLKVDTLINRIISTSQKLEERRLVYEEVYVETKFVDGIFEADQELNYTADKSKLKQE